MRSAIVGTMSIVSMFVSSTRGSGLPRRLHDQRRPHDLRQRLRDRQAAVLVAMERHAVVGGHHDGGVVEQADLLHPVEDLAHQRVGVGGLQQVPLPLEVLDPRHAAVAAVDRQIGPLGRRRRRCGRRAGGATGSGATPGGSPRPRAGRRAAARRGTPRPAPARRPTASGTRRPGSARILAGAEHVGSESGDGLPPPPRTRRSRPPGRRPPPVTRSHQRSTASWNRAPICAPLCASVHGLARRAPGAVDRTPTSGRAG